MNSIFYYFNSRIKISSESYANEIRANPNILLHKFSHNLSQILNFLVEKGLSLLHKNIHQMVVFLHFLTEIDPDMRQITNHQADLKQDSEALKWIVMKLQSMLNQDLANILLLLMIIQVIIEIMKA